MLYNLSGIRIIIYNNGDVEIEERIYTANNITADYLTTLLLNRKVSGEQINYLFSQIGRGNKNPMIWVQQGHNVMYVYRVNFVKDDTAQNSAD